MTKMTRSTNLLLAGLVSVAACAAATNAEAQCCGAPTVAVAQPVMVAQPQVVAFQEARVGLFDRWRMRRWGVTPVQPVMAAMPVQQTVGFTPWAQPVGFAPTVQTVGFAPQVQTVGFAPAVQTVGWRPHVTAFAPLQTTTFVTAARPVVMTPVVSSCSACGCDPCSCSPCGCAAPACSSCSSGVSQAVFAEPSTGCSSCSGSAGTPVYSSTPSVGPPTPQPALAPSEGVPSNSQYDANRPQIETDPAPTPTPSPESDSSTYFEPPALFHPQDKSASRATVDVHQAVYRQSGGYRGVSTASAPETDANGWYAVPSSR